MLIMRTIDNMIAESRSSHEERGLKYDHIAQVYEVLRVAPRMRSVD